MSTTTTYPIPEPLMGYFKKEFRYLLDAYYAFNKLYDEHTCCEVKRHVEDIGWSLDRHLTWFMDHFSIEAADYEFCYVNFLVGQPGWQARYDDEWEEWLDKLVAPSDADIDDIMDAYQPIDEDEDE